MSYRLILFLELALWFHYGSSSSIELKVPNSRARESIQILKANQLNFTVEICLNNFLLLVLDTFFKF